LARTFSIQKPDGTPFKFFIPKDPLRERPAYLFDENEYDDALSFLIWAALFLWDCHVISGESGYSVFLSHDEIGYSRFTSQFIEELKTR
jgi:hypothetical protein